MPPLLCSASCARVRSKDRPPFGWSNLHAAPPIRTLIPSLQTGESSTSAHSSKQSFGIVSTVAPMREIARAFQRGVATGVAHVAAQLCQNRAVDTVVLSGGVFQNELLLEDIQSLLLPHRLGYMDQPCCATERWRHQPGPGRTGRIRTIQRYKPFCLRGHCLCMSFR